MKSRIRKTAAAALMLALAGLVLAACGSSSSSTATTTSTSASATSPQGAAGAGGFAGRFNAYRECLAKQGITLPQRKPGQGGPGGFLGGGTGTRTTPQLPAGVTKAQYEAAQQKCASVRPKFGGGTGAGAGRLRSPLFLAALTKFGTCMRENGVKLPAPNTTGKGPVFDTTGIDTASAQFKAAEAKCSSTLRAGFRAGANPNGGQAG